MYEYKARTNIKPNNLHMELILCELKKIPFFATSEIIQGNIFMPGDGEDWGELVGIEIVEDGLFISVILHGDMRDVLFGVIYDTLSNSGIKVSIEEE